MAILKKLLFALLIALILFFGINYSAIIYGVQQGLGQAKIILNTEPIEDLMSDESVSNSVKQQFQFITEVKQFCENELGLKATKNYQSFYDQKGKAILWVVVASPEFEIKAKEWCFPIAGCFPYKGFFDFDKGVAEEEKMKALGYDTELDEVNAWSTLGWLNDPILSSMLKRSKGKLAELIIHESLHATLYVKDSVQFNETLASFVGKKGAEKFLEVQYGKESTELNVYKRELKRSNIFKAYMRQSIGDLNQKYATLSAVEEIQEKRRLKESWINDIKFGLLKTDYFEDKIEGRKRVRKFNLNNAYFSGFSTYSKNLPVLENQLQEEFNGNLKSMVDFFEEKYESL